MRSESTPIIEKSVQYSRRYYRSHEISNQELAKSRRMIGQQYGIVLAFVDSWKEYCKQSCQDGDAESINYIVPEMEVTSEEDFPFMVDQERGVIEATRKRKAPESDSIETEIWQELGVKVVKMVWHLLDGIWKHRKWPSKQGEFLYIRRMMQGNVLTIVQPL